MADAGVKETEKALAALEKRIENVYKEQKKEMQKKLSSFMKAFEEKNSIFEKKLKAGKITESQYNSWLKGQALQDDWFTEMIGQFSEDMTLTDVKAMSMVNGFMPEAYAINRNFGAFEAEKGALVKTSFTMYDAHTVENLIKDRPKLLPAPSPDIPKEMRWHQIKITNAVRDGILQGESVSEIATRLQAVTDMDRNAALRNARTATTGAQNAGRVDSYKDAEKMGIELEQQWLATLDGRTRDRHRLMDGEKVKPGKKFSNGCRYPGDPTGEAAEIYNCRCTLIAVIDGADYSQAERFSRLEGMSYEDWKFNKDEVKKYEYYSEKVKGKIADLGNPVYSGIWKDDVKLSDYANKKDSIQGKKDWYEEEIDKLKNDESYKPWMHPDVRREKIEQYEKYLKSLEDFQKKGELYERYRTELDGYTKKLKELKPVTSPFGADAYSDERKKAAKDFYYRRDADKYLRPMFDEKWDDLTDYQKYSVWEYTRNSNPINQPLSGYEDGWSRSDFVGLGKADWSLQDKWRRYNTTEFAKKFGTDGHVDYGKTISELTRAIDGSTFADTDMWLVRKSGNDGLAGLFEGNLFSYDEAMAIIRTGDTQKMKDAFVGQVFQNHAFCSSGMAKDAHWSGNVSYKIYAPQGTKGIYAEPASYFGDTISGEKIYKVGQSYRSVGSEAEVILQRGTSYRVTDIKYSYGDIEVTMEVVDQPNYFKTGFEQTFDGGQTSWSK